MSQRKSPSIGLSPLVAVILLIAITVAAAVVVAGVFFNLSTTAGRRPSVVIDQIRLVVGSGATTFVLVLKNTGDVPIHPTTNPTVTISGLPTGCTLSPSTWSGSRDPGKTYATSVTSTAAACANTLGNTYPVTITVTFADNSAQTLATTITGSLA